MAVVEELIRKEADGTISFGNYLLENKAKIDNFEVRGDLYKVKTFKEITKLERNGKLVYESVPGTAVSGLKVQGDSVEFVVEGPEDVQITMELEEETTYRIYLNNAALGEMKTNLGGKLSLGIELSNEDRAEVKICK